MFCLTQAVQLDWETAPACNNKMTAITNLKFYMFQNFSCQAQEKMRSNEFCDVTLVSADNNKFEAHKVILASYSNVF